jgi:hypothetical protein
VADEWNSNCPPDTIRQRLLAGREQRISYMLVDLPPN